MSQTQPARVPGDSSAYCTFRLAGGLYGFPIETVREVSAITECTRVPRAPAAIAGCVNIRGQIHLALDLRVVLGLGGVTAGADRRLVLLKAQVAPALGVLVDELGEIVFADGLREELVPNPESPDPARGGSDLICRRCQLAGELLAVLDPRRLLPWVDRAFSPESDGLSTCPT